MESGTACLTDEAKSGCLYVFENNANGKCYVGQTWNVKRRIKDHFNGRGCAKLLAAAIKKYGTSMFTTRVIESGIHTQDILDEKEIKAIIEFNSLVPNGYNINKGGFGGQHSESTKRLIGSYHKGKVVSAETKTKLRLANLNRPPILGDAKQRMIEGIRNHHDQKKRPVYIFDASSHEKVHTYKNITLFLRDNSQYGRTQRCPQKLGHLFVGVAMGLVACGLQSRGCTRQLHTREYGRAFSTWTRPR